MGFPAYLKKFNSKSLIQKFQYKILLKFYGELLNEMDYNNVKIAYKNCIRIK